MLEQAFGLTRPPPASVLGSWPTPVARLDGLGAALSADLWIKRDDLAGRAYGGNKVRKLEFLLGEAHVRGCRSAVTVGGIGSHQVIATAVYAREAGMETHAVVFRQPVTPAVRANLRLAAGLGVRFVPLSDPDALPEALERACAQAAAPVALIPAGGSSPAGNLGYVAAAVELRQQIDSGELPEPDEIVVPFGSGGTLAGLALGCALLGIRSRLLGVRAAAETVTQPEVVRRQATALAGQLRRLGARIEPQPELHFEVRGDALGAGYGVPTPEAEQAVIRARESDGVCLETTYSGKAMAALIQHCGAAGRGRRLLFWNTCNGHDTGPLLHGAAEPTLPPRLAEWLEGPALAGACA